MEDLTMVNSKDILTRLQNGEKAEDIANELISALNDANDVYNKEVAAKKAEDEAKAKREAKKVADMQDIVDLLHDFCIEYYCDNNEDINAVEEAFNELTAEKLIAIVEEAGAAVLDIEKSLKDIEKMFGVFNAAPVKTIKIGKDFVPGKKDADKVISNFLKSIGL
jgi:hypothetical protein